MSGTPDSFLKNYQEVEAFAEGDEEEYEEETFYVTLDLGPLDPNLLPHATNYRLIGLETATPFLQIGGTTFKGEHETLLGTEIILQEPSAIPNTPRHFAPLTTTDKRVRFREVRLRPKQAMDWTVDDNEIDGDGEAPVVQPNKTLGGVSRDAQTEFFPSSKKGALSNRPKRKRRQRKQSEGHPSSDEDGAKKPTTKSANKKSIGHESDENGGPGEESDRMMNEESGEVE